MSKVHIGYGTLEEWAAAIDKTRPVFAEAITNQGMSDKRGLRVDRAEIVCAQPDDRGDVHYCLLPVGRWQELSGAREFGARQRGKILEQQKVVWRIVEDWLQEHGLTVRHAIVAMPRTLKLLDAWAGFIQWDKEREVYYRPNGEARA